MAARTITLVVLGLAFAGGTFAAAQPEARRLVGRAAFGDWSQDEPGLWRRITAADLPPPGPAAANPSLLLIRPPGALPKVPPGFAVTEFAADLKQPRVLKTAPNGDVFVAESASGRVRVLRPGAGGKAASVSTFAENLDRPFGMAFWPEADPRFVYVAENNAVRRYPYRAGDLRATGPAQTVVARLTETARGHWTRDIAFSADGARMLVSVGSESNVADKLPKKTPAEIAAWEKAHGTGAAWGGETDRAAVLSFTPEGGDRRVFATGLRNCVGLSRHPATGDLYCAVNERDALGDNLVPDYVTRVRANGWYGWPWYYLGANEDPRHKGARPDLAGKAIVPDVLFQAHSAALQTAFYPAAAAGPAAFPEEYRGDGFVALHGSWNRAQRTGYKVVRIKLRNGVPTGDYQDFLTGLVAANGQVWGRPVGVTVARDGSLLVGDEGAGVVWRVAPRR